MLLRCASKMMMGPPVMMAGMAMTAAALGALALGATVVGGALLAKRLHDERQGWREGAAEMPATTTATEEPPPISA